MVIAGSIRAARNAGIQQATIPIAAIIVTTPIRVTGPEAITARRNVFVTVPCDQECREVTQRSRDRSIAHVIPT